MTALTLDSNPVLSASISMPRIGTWFADVTVSGEVALSGQVALTDGSSGLLGAVINQDGAFAGRTFTRLVGGAGGLRNVLSPRHYRSASVGKILGDICSEAGEKKSLLIDPRLSLQRVPYWSRPAGTGGAALANLCDSLGAVWRVLPTGEVWIGEPGLSLAAPSEYQVLDRDPLDGSYDIAIDGPSLWVGMSQAAGTIRRIEYSFDEIGRARYWVD